jgi:5-methylcytosine-specific restriction protein B
LAVTRDEIQQSLSDYDAAADAEHLRLGAQERDQILERFPRSAWPEMSLAEYAIGQEDSSNTYCRWAEFNTPHLGSIRGGSSAKLIIYKRKNDPGWHYDEAAFDSVHDAWEAVRSQFVQAIALADQGDWPAIEELSALRSGQALLVKTLHIYFQDKVLPISSREHLRHFLSLLGRGEAATATAGAVTLNQLLLTALRELSPERLTTNELERFLYRHYPPPATAKWFKISPGSGAKYWPECRAGGFICVGWDELGDLRDYGTKDEYRAAFTQARGADYNNRPHVISKKANELWTMMELRPGDKVVANEGKSRILALGTVREPGYSFDPSREKYRHLVSVDWDESFAKQIPQQGGWMNTIDKVTLEQRKLITGPQPPLDGPDPDVDALYRRIADALEQKRQVVLFGPPGTGKTYHVRRFAAWWLSQKAQRPNAAEVLSDDGALAATERELSGRGLTANAWFVVANPDEGWQWDRLFQDGTVEFSQRRMKRNYPLVQVGDLVFGYESGGSGGIVALARTSRALGVSDGSTDPSISLEPVLKLSGTVSYQDLASDEIIGNSEPLRNGVRGTLFRLTAQESERLLTLVANIDSRAVEALDDAETVGQWSFTTFHPSYAYEDFVEGFRPIQSDTDELRLRLEDGIFKRICRAAQADPEQPYLLVVDELNRANVAKVFGELITLLEADKRGLIVTLPQSKERFTIPKNVYLVGTMNTADRSITLLDVALRRRFAFIELMPDAELIEEAVGPLDLAEFLAALNREIRRVAGREKQVGHGYLMPGGSPISEPSDFARAFRLEILPLLQEYCYDEYGQLAEILGDRLVDAEAQALNDELLDDSDALVEALAAQFSASTARAGEQQ